MIVFLRDDDRDGVGRVPGRRVVGSADERGWRSGGEQLAAAVRERSGWIVRLPRGLASGHLLRLSVAAVAVLLVLAAVAVGLTGHLPAPRSRTWTPGATT